MLDWPLASQTSPTNTFLKVSEVLRRSYREGPAHLAGLHCAETGSPFALIIRFCSSSLSCKFNSNHRPCRCRAPDRNLDSSLENGVVTVDSSHVERLLSAALKGGERGEGAAQDERI